MGDPLLAAAEIGEVAAEHRERSDLRLARTDISSERERLLADRQRLRVAPDHPQNPRERRQRICALRRRRLRRHELDRPLDCGEASLFTPGLLEVLAEAHMEQGRTVRVALADGSIACRPSSTARAAAPIWLASSAVRVHNSARSSPASSAASGTAPHSASARSRCARASARPKTASA